MDMRRALKDRLANYKIPQELKLLDDIPKNAMGKGEFQALTFRARSDKKAVNKKSLAKDIFGPNA